MGRWAAPCRRTFAGGFTLAVLLLALAAWPAAGQVEVDPVLEGVVRVGDEPMDSGTVVLHRIDDAIQGEIDSTRVASGGAFTFSLPSVPAAGSGEMYFASTRHQGVLYFGGAVTAPAQLDSLYEIQAWDTLVVSDPGGRELPVAIRNVFLEEEETDWLVTDLIQVRNDAEGTLVSLGDGVVWRYPLPEEATSPSLGGEFIPGSSEFQDGDLVVYSALPPGERVFVIRYRVPDPYITLPLPGETGVLEVLVREPAPPVEVPALQAGLQVELEPGSTYRRYSGTDLTDARIAMVEGREEGSVPVEWLAVALGLLLAGVALWAVLGRPRAAPAPAGPAAAPADGGDGARRGLLLEIARLDRDFEALEDPGDEERARYRRARRALLDRLSDAG
jgi:hypothetical protein